VLRVGGGSGDDILMLRQERLKEKLLAKQRAANAVHLKEKELSAAEDLCSSLKQEIQVCKAATRECLEKVDEVRSRRAQQDTPPTLLFHSSFAPGMLEGANAACA
jgi:chromosome segregation ATPase